MNFTKSVMKPFLMMWTFAVTDTKELEGGITKIIKSLFT